MVQKEMDENGILEELEYEDIEIINISEFDIVKKYDEGQARIVIQRNDFLIPNIMQMVKDRDILNLAPSYQRRKRWNDTKRSHLIESLLINIPIPPIFLYECDLAKYEVMDGQQRMDAIRGFFKNEYALTSLKKWPELNGRKYSDLPERIQAGLNRRGLAAIIILTESGQSEDAAMEIRQYVFERLNTGGEKLNAQEIRNCIYASPFNDMLVEISRSNLFTDAWNIPPKEPDEPQKVSKALEKNRLYSVMADCEIVLRFFALEDMKYFKGGMKRALDDCMQRMKGLSKKECLARKNKYLRCLSIAVKTFGPALFRLPNKKGELIARHSVPLSDAILLGISSLKESEAITIQSSSAKVVERMKIMLNSEDSYKTLVGRANTKSSIVDRIDLVAKMFKSVAAGT
jgi:hypothetical protein